MGISGFLANADVETAGLGGASKSQSSNCASYNGVRNQVTILSVRTLTRSGSGSGSSFSSASSTAKILLLPTLPISPDTSSSSSTPGMITDVDCFNGEGFIKDELLIVRWDGSGVRGLDTRRIGRWDLLGVLSNGDPRVTEISRDVICLVAGKS